MALEVFIVCVKLLNQPYKQIYCCAGWSVSVGQYGF